VRRGGARRAFHLRPVDGIPGGDGDDRRDHRDQRRAGGARREFPENEVIGRYVPDATYQRRKPNAAIAMPAAVPANDVSQNARVPVSSAIEQRTIATSRQISAASKKLARREAARVSSSSCSFCLRISSACCFSSSPFFFQSAAAAEPCGPISDASCASV